MFNEIAAVCACENLVFASTESRQIWVRFPSSPSLGRCNRLHACNRGPGFLAKVYSSFLFSDYRVTCPLWIDLPSTPDLIFAVTSIWAAMQWYQFVFILTLLAVPATCKTNSASVAVLVFYKSIYEGVADVLSSTRRHMFHLEFLSQYHSFLNTPFSVVDTCEITHLKSRYSLRSWF